VKKPKHLVVAAPPPGRTALVVEDDDLVGEAVSVQLAASGYDVTLCTEAACAAVFLERERYDVVLTDLHLRRGFAFDGLGIAARARAVDPSTAVVLMTGFATAEAIEAGESLGASVLAKPFDTAQLDEVVPAGDAGRIGSRVRMPPLEEVLSRHILPPQFQPIVRLGGGEVAPFGAEALMRIDRDLPLNGPESIFRYAIHRNAVPQLDLEALRRIFVHAESLDIEALFVNVHPRSLMDAAFASEMLTIVEATAIDPAAVVVEITEHDLLQNTSTAARTLAILRAAGIRFALDDLGQAHSHLQLVDFIAPSFVKLSVDIGPSNVPATRHTLLRNLAAMAHELGCEVIAERIETAEDETIVRAIGIDFGQGYRFGPPADASQLRRSTGR